MYWIVESCQTEYKVCCNLVEECEYSPVNQFLCCVCWYSSFPAGLTLQTHSTQLTWAAGAAASPLVSDQPLTTVLFQSTTPPLHRHPIFLQRGQCHRFTTCRTVRCTATAPFNAARRPH